MLALPLSHSSSSFSSFSHLSSLSPGLFVSTQGQPHHGSSQPRRRETHNPLMWREGERGGGTRQRQEDVKHIKLEGHGDARDRVEWRKMRRRIQKVEREGEGEIKERKDEASNWCVGVTWTCLSIICSFMQVC